MTDYAWSELRDRAVEAFGDTPTAAIEDRILAVFTRRPATVAVAIDAIADRYRRGLVRSPWPVLATHVEQAEGRELNVTDSRERDGAIDRAERWIRATGIHFDRAAEIEDELFDASGAVLAPWKDDGKLRARMVELWQSERPRGVQTERESDERAKRYREWRARQHA